MMFYTITARGKSIQWAVLIEHCTVKSSLEIEKKTIFLIAQPSCIQGVQQSLIVCLQLDRCREKLFPQQIHFCS